MSQGRVYTELLGIQGWRVAPHGIRLDGEVVEVAIQPRRGHGRFCSGCGQGHLFVYDHAPERRVRDFPVWGRRCWLIFRPARVDCPRCGIRTERLDWIGPHARQTLRYERYVAMLCEILPVLDVARLEGLGKNAVARIDRRWLQRRAEQRGIHPVRYLGIDEIAIRSGHRYATVFYDLRRREVIGLVMSRREKAVSGWLRRWGRTMCRGVVAVCMDLWTPYRNAIHRHCPNAAIVFDKFHVFGYLSLAIESVRRHEQSICADETSRLMKGTRWLWLKSRANLRRKQRQTLDEIMALNRNLTKAYLLKEDFADFYVCLDREDAERFLHGWMKRCRESRLEPFIKLAERLERWKEGILAFFDHRITNGVAEGINNKIKVLKRRAYGFHDEKYFFLKIMQATGALPSLNQAAHP